METGSPPPALVSSAIGCASAGGRIVARRLAPDRRGIVLLYVVLDHPPGGEAGAGEPECVPHLVHPSDRHVGGVPVVIERDDLILEQPVEPLRIGSIGILGVAGGRDGPAAQPVVTLLPPAVEGAQ